MQSESFLALLDQIYDTVLDPARWPSTLTSVSDHIGASFMSVVPYSDPSAIFMSKGGEHAMAGYTEHWFALDTMVKVGIRNKHRRDLLCDWSSIGLETIERDSYYQEFRRDVGLGYCIGSSFEAYPGDFRALGINLPLGRSALEQQELDKIDTILRHLARAITISSRTQNLQVTLPAFSEVLDRIRCGAAIVDATGRIASANQALRDFAPEGLDITSGKIQCAWAGSQATLDRLIQNATCGLSTKSAMDFALIARPCGRKPLMARAVPLSRQAAEGIWRKHPSERQALLLVVDLAAEANASCEQALKQLGLTAAEARVANLIGSGHSTRQTAAQLGTTEGTVRKPTETGLREDGAHAPVGSGSRDQPDLSDLASLRHSGSLLSTPMI